MLEVLKKQPEKKHGGNITNQFISSLEMNIPDEFCKRPGIGMNDLNLYVDF